MMSQYAKTLTDASKILQIPYSQLYRYKHRSEFQKTSKGYNIEKIAAYIAEQDRIKEEEAKADELAQTEEDFIEKQIKLETAKHKCRLLELQIMQKEGNLVEVDKILETRTKEISLLRRDLTNLIQQLPAILVGMTEEEIRSTISERVNEVLSNLSELIADDWEDAPIEFEEEKE